MRVLLVDVLTVPGFGPRRGFCRNGARAWFEAHGFVWADFVRDGIDSATLLATGDALASAVVTWAKQNRSEANGVE